MPEVNEVLDKIFRRKHLSTGAFLFFFFFFFFFFFHVYIEIWDKGKLKFNKFSK